MHSVAKDHDERVRRGQFQIGIAAANLQRLVRGCPGRDRNEVHGGREQVGELRRGRRLHCHAHTTSFTRCDYQLITSYPRIAHIS